MTFDVNNWPARCPFGHTLGPGTGSMSWDTEIRRHWLMCCGCDFKTGIVLEEEGAEWQVRFPGRGWVPFEG